MLRDEDGKDDQKSIKMILCKIVTIIMLRCTIEAYLISDWRRPPPGWDGGRGPLLGDGGRPPPRGDAQPLGAALLRPGGGAQYAALSIKCHGAKNRHFEMNMTIFLPHWKPHIQPFLKMGCTD